MAFHPLSPFTSTNLVLTFHGVPSAGWFRRALETVGRFYRFVAVEDLVAFFHAGRPLNGCCLVTFDDGERSFAESAVPVLEALAVPALLFVSPGVLGCGANYWFQDLRLVRAGAGDDAVRQTLAAQMGLPLEQIARYGVLSLVKSLPLASIEALLDDLAQQYHIPRNQRCNLTLPEVQELDQHALLTVGAHSLSHPILANETGEKARQEIAGSVAALQALLGRPVTVFAYPNGARGLDFGAREQALLHECGVKLAFATDSGFWSAATDPLAIPRTALSGDESSGEILARLAAVPVWDRLRTGREGKERRELQRMTGAAAAPEASA